MPRRTSTIVLWLFVINLGIAFGAGVYEHRIVVPQWLETAPDGLSWSAAAAREDDTGLRFWAFVSTGPLTLLTLANLLAAWRAPAQMRRWWLTAAGLALADRLVTFGYFIPTMIGLMEMPDSPVSVAIASRWMVANRLRHVLVLGAWLSALETFARRYRYEEAWGLGRERQEAA